MPDIVQHLCHRHQPGARGSVPLVATSPKCPLSTRLRAVCGRDDERRVLSAVTVVGGARRFLRWSVEVPLPRGAATSHSAYSSTCSEMLSASSTSMPSQRTVLSSFVCPRSSWTAADCLSSCRSGRLRSPHRMRAVAEPRPGSQPSMDDPRTAGSRRAARPEAAREEVLSIPGLNLGSWLDRGSGLLVISN